MPIHRKYTEVLHEKVTVIGCVVCNNVKFVLPKTYIQERHPVAVIKSSKSCNWSLKADIWAVMSFPSCSVTG